MTAKGNGQFAKPLITEGTVHEGDSATIGVRVPGGARFCGLHLGKTEPLFNWNFPPDPIRDRVEVHCALVADPRTGSGKDGR